MVTSIDREEVQRLLAAGAQIVEVLGYREYAEEHVAGAVNVPLGRLGPDTVSELDRERSIIVYCYDTE